MKLFRISAAALALPAWARAQAAAPVKIGEGKWTYTLDESWGRLPEGMSWGFGCGIVVDSKDRVYVTSRSASPCVAIFGPDGKLEETWSKDFGNGYDPEQVTGFAFGLGVERVCARRHNVTDIREFYKNDVRFLEQF